MLARAGEAGDIDGEVADVLRAILPSVQSESIETMIQDAMTARALSDAGDQEGAREIVERYRTIADQCGMGPMFDSMFVDMLTD
jgi:hypothetical protein